MKLTQFNNYTKNGIIALMSVFGLALPSFADVIDFDSEFPAGPSLYTGVEQTLTTDNTTFSGGQILTATANCPADETSIYASASPSLVGGSLTDPIVIFNASGFNNFFFDLLNGQTYIETYTVSDNAGHSANFTIAPNTSSGVALVGFASTGTQVTITTTDPNWDFAIDNVNFDEPLPPSLSAPEVSSTAWLLVGGLTSLAVFASRRRAIA